MLREASFSLKREAAADVDRVTWRQYGEALEDNLQDLSERLKRGGTGRSRFGAEPLPVPGWLALVPLALATQPKGPPHLGAHAAAHRPLVASDPHLPPLSLEATWRHHLRQESGAVTSLAGICGGGDQRWSFVLQLTV